MIRTLARFDDPGRARAAVQALISASFPPEDVGLHAVLADGVRVDVPVGVRSHAWVGAALGFALTAPIGVWLGLEYGIPVVSAAMGAGGTGLIVGSTVGLGSWTVAIAQPPREIRTLYVTVDAPEGRAPQAEALLSGAGGVPTALHSVEPVEPEPVEPVTGA